MEAITTLVTAKKGGRDRVEAPDAAFRLNRIGG